MRLTYTLLSKLKPDRINSLTRFVELYSKYEPTALSIKQFRDFGRNPSERDSFKFLKKEIPVRLANMMQEIRVAPEQLMNTHSARLVISWYWQSFDEILQFENADIDDTNVREKFSKTLVNIRNRHVNVVPTMAEGVLEMRDVGGFDSDSSSDCVLGENITYFLNRFYMNRISIRMLLNQHTLLFYTHRAKNSIGIGSIDAKCDVCEQIKLAYDDAKHLCELNYLASPDMELEILGGGDQSTVNMVYVPSHLYHILFEILKNSMRATLEHTGYDADVYPPIKISVCKGLEDVSIKVSDCGGGISQRKIDKVFEYMYTTAPRPVHGEVTPLAGYGYGLPISRLYARYFLGNLSLQSMEGHGTDAFIYLKFLSSDADELLPVYNAGVKQYYEKSRVCYDWTTGRDRNRNMFGGGSGSR